MGNINGKGHDNFTSAQEGELSAAAFLRVADQEYIVSRCLCLNLFIFQAAYMAHQALEKYLKALHIKHAGQYRLDHDLIKILDDCLRLDMPTKALKRLDSLRDLLDKFNKYSTFFRYPEGGKNRPKEDVFGTNDIIPKLDEAVFYIRSLINLKTSGGIDCLFEQKESSLNPMQRNSLLYLMKRNSYFGEIVIRKKPDQ